MKQTKFFMTAACLMMSALTAMNFTSCSDEDDTEDDAAEIAEKFNLDYLTATANNNGTITISGTVTTNKKLKTFTLTAEDGTVYDLLDNSEAEKERTEDGKTWTCTLSSQAIPVGIYTMEVRTRMAGTKKATIGKTYSFNVGTGDNKTIGSYMSLKNQKSYMMTDLLNDDKTVATDVCSDVEIILNSDLTIKSAKEAKNAVIKAAAAAANVYAAKGCVITETGCIATYSIETDATDKTLATISGVVMTSNEDDLVKVDVSGETFTK